MKRIPPPKGCKAMLVGLGKEWYCGDCDDLTWDADKNQPQGCKVNAEQEEDGDWKSRPDGGPA